MKVGTILAAATLIAGSLAAQGAKVDHYTQAELLEKIQQLTAQADAHNGAAGKILDNYSNHFTMVSLRTKDGRAEIHDNLADLFVVLEGKATLVTGGTILNAKPNGPGETLGSAIKGGASEVLNKGDVVHIPAGEPHQLLLTAGGTFSYFVVKFKGQIPESERASFLGDSQAIAPPLATDLSAELSKKNVAHAIKKVADWQLAKSQAGFDQDWTFAALYTGFMSVPEAANGKRYQDAMLRMAQKFSYELGPRPTHADDHAVGDTYLELSNRLHDPAIIAPTTERMKELLQVPDDPQKPLWWWCDALFMAPPVLAKLARATGDRKYLDFMDHQWWITSNLLYNQQNHLYFRDSSYFDKHHANGKNIFWSRGNGWVFAGLARVLAVMPKDYPSRPKYEAQFREMAEELSSIQGKDGLWRPGLLDPDAYPLPENSGSAYFTFGFAYGVNSGLIDRKQYLPVVEKGWRGLLQHIYQDGRLGCIQPIGGSPDIFTETSSYVFGTGAFLLAGSEVYKLAK